MIQIEACLPTDADEILALYDHARTLQQKHEMVIWPEFSKAFVEQEILEQKQFKLLINNRIACNWAITYEDKDIWEEKDLNDSVFIHRIVTHPDFRGQRHIDAIVQWAERHARAKGRQYIRLDTLGNNTRLIEHYTSAGFDFLGVFKLANTASLPLHYQKEPACLLFERALN